jgi:uncharacterized membrane protein YkvA (DUF1232 family)
MKEETNYQEEYSEFKFWEKVKKYTIRAGKEVTLFALTLYYCLKDRDTPNWAKAVIIGALGYFICPIDAVPDMIPVVGYADDLAILTAALTTVNMYIKQHHRKSAEDTLNKCFRISEVESC